jgi:putative ABC transport system substrate-binding protein
MKRRAILLAGGAGLVLPWQVLAQGAKRRRVTIAIPGTEAGFRLHLAAFRQALKSHGWSDENLGLDVRWNDGRAERFPALAAQVVAADPEVIVTGTSAGVAAFKKATSSIPIVFTTAANAVERGFVASLRRPGGNITGVAVYPGLTRMLVEITREALPSAQRVALLVHEADPSHQMMVDNFEPAAQRASLEALIARVQRAEDFERAFADLGARNVEALLVPQLALFTSYRVELARRALKLRLPLIANSPLYADAGALLSYGVSTEENYRRAAALVDRILRGAKPGELPVELPKRFALVVNRKTVLAIGAKLSSATILRADRIID